MTEFGKCECQTPLGHVGERFSLKAMTTAEEAKIGGLVKKAMN